MLVLARKRNEEIVIGAGKETIVVKVIEVLPDRVKLGITAPQTVSVLRHELLKPKTPKNGVERQTDGESVSSV